MMHQLRVTVLVLLDCLCIYLPLFFFQRPILSYPRALHFLSHFNLILGYFYFFFVVALKYLFRFSLISLSNPEYFFLRKFTFGIYVPFLLYIKKLVLLQAAGTSISADSITHILATVEVYLCSCIAH